MPFPLQLSSTCVLFLAYLCISIPFPVNGNLMNEVCNQVTDKALCFEILRNDPRSRSEKIKDFAEIAVEVAVKNSTSLPIFVESLANKTTDPTLKQKLLRCVVNTKDAKRDITQAKEFVAARQYGPANNMASQASVALSECDNNFWLPPAVEEPIELRQETHRLEDLVVIVAVCTNDLL